jgi:acetolactate synthase I/II/III large subunit
MSSMATGQVMADSLIAHGVDTVFGIPGAHMYDFNDALAQRQEQLRFITTRHEQGAAYPVECWAWPFPHPPPPPG